MKVMYFYEKLRFWTGRALSFYSTTVMCFLCGKEFSAEKNRVFNSSLCTSCMNLLNRTATLVFSGTERCIKCGRPLVSKQEICSGCENIPVFSYLDRAFPLFPYKGWGRIFMSSWKLSEERGMVFFPAGILGSVIKMYFKDYLIVPVPPRKGKFRVVGWDQIDDLCRVLKRLSGVDSFPVLCRTSYLQQKKLDKMHRINGLKGKIEISPKVEKLNLNGRKVLLLDDVMTTGATLETCAEVLKGKGVSRVEAVVLFFD